MSNNAQNIIDLPRPPLSMTSDGDALAGAEIEVQFLSGSVEKGSLISLQGPQQSVVVKTTHTACPRDISFSIIRSVKINRPIELQGNRQPLTARSNDVQLPEKSQPFQLHYNDNRVVDGVTWGWLVDEYGLHLFPRDTAGNSFRMFIPLQVLSLIHI